MLLHMKCTGLVPAFSVMVPGTTGRYRVGVGPWKQGLRGGVHHRGGSVTEGGVCPILGPPNRTVHGSGSRNKILQATCIRYMSHKQLAKQEYIQSYTGRLSYFSTKAVGISLLPGSQGGTCAALQQWGPDTANREHS